MKEEGLVGALISRARVFPTEGAAASALGLTVAFGQFDFSRKVRNLHFCEVCIFILHVIN